MQLPLTIKLRPSRLFGVLLLLVHTGALAAAGLAALPLWPRALLAAGIAASAWLSLRRLVGSARVRALTLRADGRLELERSSGSAGVAVLAQSAVLPWLVVLLWRCAGRREAVAILPDPLDPDEFRVLRLWLRWRAELS